MFVFQLLKYWPFGSVWCSIWLAVDVWMCTASILNLCAISFDRYLAISRPFRYPQLMSPLRVKMLIVCVWILSFVICLPPLVGWNERKRGQIEDTEPTENATDRDDITRSSDRSSETFPIECKLTSEPGYIVYSALGSFWIPMIVMLGFYWRIYRTATAATAAFRRGFLEKKARGTAGGVSTSSSDNSITLRVHRGGGMSPTRRSDGSLSDSGVAATAKNNRRSMDERVASATGPRFALLCQGRSDSPAEEKNLRMRKFIKLPKIVVTSNECLKKPMEMMALSLDRNGRQVVTTEVVPHPHPPTGGGGGVAVTRYNSANKDVVTDIVNRRKGTIPTRMTETSRLSKFPSLLPQLRSLNREKKAAKTVGIIVGCFVLCWAPFFTVYLLRAFCPLCTPNVVFDVCFWLGYCNSAVNPIIYGLCSRDFCYAFKKLVRCRCERKRANGPRPGTRLTRMLRNLRIQIATTTAAATASVSDVNVS